MKQFSLLCTLFLLTFTGFAQDSQVLITIGDRGFTVDEFERLYRKNNSNLLESADKKTPEGYVDLFVNYKLKVMEAESLKLDTFQAFRDELAGYRKELAAPYLTDVSFNEKMIDELYARMKTEVLAGHILFNLPKNATPEDTLAIYQKAISVREKILGGLDFREAATQFSEDPSAKSNHGDLGYFSAFQMVAPFEDGAFSTPVGSVSMPVKTSFGYHLIKIYDKRDALGEIKVAHIMKAFPPNVDENGMKRLKSEMDSIYQLLRKGAKFDELAKKLSDDKRSAENGGVLSWFSPGQMVNDFSAPAFALKFNGDYTQPVATQYGYHIIKRLDRRTVKSIEDARSEIEYRIKSDPERSNYSKTVFIQKLKSEYKFKINEKVVADLKSNKYPIASSPGQTEWLIEIDGKQHTVSEFIGYVEKEFPDTRSFNESLFAITFNSWIENTLTAYEDSRLETKYPEFRYLLQEYHDGILLFNISDQKIWSKAANDSIGLEKFYEQNKGKYLWGERFKGLIVHCSDQKSRDDVDKYFSVGMEKQEILDRVNSNGEKVTMEEGAWEKNTNPIVDYFIWNGVKPEGFNELLEFVRGDKIGPEPKMLNEAKGLYLSDYQNYLEQKWIKSLREKSKIKVDKKLLKTIADASN
jgi:peptidyl-prolyl cis-trans isomerase SurA